MKKGKRSPEDFAAAMSLMTAMLARKASSYARRAQKALGYGSHLNTTREDARRRRQIERGIIRPN